ncbi:MAG: stage II sporulation protein R [Syntrophomonadaceae bacterium]|jgi:stage II sporulation protein R
MKKIIAIILLLAGLGMGYFYMGNTATLGQSVLRLHVVAHSDSINDQVLKLEVKDKIVECMQGKFAGTQNVKEARELAMASTPEITKIAESIIRSKGYDYPVAVQIGEYDFPTKSYGNVVFPQGKYEAVRIVIGDGQGKNWWCVLFPPLCMVTSTEKGLSIDSPKEAEVSLKCLELIPKGMKIKVSDN